MAGIGTVEEESETAADKPVCHRSPLKSCFGGNWEVQRAAPKDQGHIQGTLC